MSSRNKNAAPADAASPEQQLLAADAFMNDPRIAQARSLILDALRDHQANLADIREPQDRRLADYQALLEQFANLRGGGLYYPYIGSGFGNGCLVELADGSVKYDFITGIGPHGWGHCNPDIVDASIVAACQDTVMQGNLQQNVESVKLAQSLVDAACAKGAALEHCFLTSSGAMANENALKLVFAKKSPADRLLAFEHCFAGRSMALAAVTDKPNYRVGLPATLSVDYVPFFDADEPQASTDRTLRVVGEHLSRYPGRHAGMILELVQGEGGYYPGSVDYFAKLAALLREHDVAIVIDEIQTFGRLEKMFAFQHFKLDAYADVVSIGKLSQVCATLFTDAYKPAPGLVSQTFTSSTTAIAAARVILRQLKSGGFFGPSGRIAKLHDCFASRLESISKKHPNRLAGPFGIGAMIAFTPFDGLPAQAKAVAHRLFENGVIAFVAGGAPARVRFLMPIGVVTEADIDQVCRILEQTLDELAESQEARDD